MTIGFYSPFHNSTAFIDKSLDLYFIVHHDENKIYFYTTQIFYEDTSELYMQWKRDIVNGNCKHAQTLNEATLYKGLLDLLRCVAFKN